MAAVPGICTQAKLAWLKSMAQDDIWIALYGPTANINPHTPHYTLEGEVIGMGYDAGGKRMTGINFGVTGSRAWIDWDDPRWDFCTIKASSAMIYNKSKSNLALCVLVFGDVISSTNGPWWLELPPPGENALLRWA